MCTCMTAAVLIILYTLTGHTRVYLSHVIGCITYNICVHQLQMHNFVLLVPGRFMPAATLKNKKLLDVDFRNRGKKSEGIA